MPELAPTRTPFSGLAGKANGRLPLVSTRNSFFSELAGKGWAHFAVAVASAVLVFAGTLLWEQRQGLRAHVQTEAADMPWMVFLEAHADKGVLEEALQAMPGLRAIRFISKEEALESVQKDPDLAQSLALTGRNPFPESFEIKWDPLYLRRFYLEHAAEKIRALDGVELVAYDGPRVQRAGLLQRSLYQLELIFLVALWVSVFSLAVLLGRVSFFPRGPMDTRRFWALTLAGAMGGAAGAGAAYALVEIFFWQVAAAGAVLGLLAALIQTVFQEP